MIRLKLQSTEGTLVWSSPTAPLHVRALLPFWSIAAETFAPDEMPPSIFDIVLEVIGPDDVLDSAFTGSIHGRSCYLGFDEYEKRYYFAKGIGWIMSTGWEPKDGSCGILPLWAAERERDIALELTKLGLDVVRPEAILLHGVIPDSQGRESYPAEKIPDLDGTPAKPCMYVYSSPTRWRIADLTFLSEKERNAILPDDKSQWLCSLLAKLGRSCRILHEHGGHDYSLRASL